MNPFDKDSSQQGAGGGISQYGIDMLAGAARWARFLAIVGFIMCGLMVLGGMIVMMAGGTMPRRSFGDPDIPAFVLGLYYCIAALIYFFPTLQLNNFASRTLNAIVTNNQATLESGFESLRNMFRLTGIYTIVGIGLMVVAVFLTFAAMGMR
ncbi:MAG: DUF5362 family protein [Bacteroidia bacterium]